MKALRADDEDGIAVPSPYERTIRVLFAPDRQEVAEVTFSHVSIPPGSRTDTHEHDRPELIYIMSGQGRSTCDDAIVELDANVALWVEAGETHGIVNTGDDPLVFVTLFVPAYSAEALYEACLDRAARRP